MPNSMDSANTLCGAILALRKHTRRWNRAHQQRHAAAALAYNEASRNAVTDEEVNVALHAYIDGTTRILTRVDSDLTRFRLLFDRIGVTMPSEMIGCMAQMERCCDAFRTSLADPVDVQARDAGQVEHTRLVDIMRPMMARVASREVHRHDE